METISYTAARTQLAKKMTQICEDHTPIIITRARAKPVVMISLDDYEAIEETNYLLSSPTNAERLSAAIDEIESIIANTIIIKMQKTLSDKQKNTVNDHVA